MKMAVEKKKKCSGFPFLYFSIIRSGTGVSRDRNRTALGLLVKPIFNKSIPRCSFDSSVGRAEDCRVKKIVILRSLVQIRLEGKFLFFLSSFKNNLS